MLVFTFSTETTPMIIAYWIRITIPQEFGYMGGTTWQLPPGKTLPPKINAPSLASLAISGRIIQAELINNTTLSSYLHKTWQ